MADLLPISYLISRIRALLQNDGTFRTIHAGHTSIASAVYHNPETPQLSGCRGISSITHHLFLVFWEFFPQFQVTMYLFLFKSNVGLRCSSLIRPPELNPRRELGPHRYSQLWVKFQAWLLGDFFLRQRLSPTSPLSSLIQTRNQTALKYPSFTDLRRNGGQER